MTINSNRKRFALTLGAIVAAISIMNIIMSSRAVVVTPSVALGQGESLDEALISENNQHAMIRTARTTPAATTEDIRTTVRHASTPEMRNDTTATLTNPHDAGLGGVFLEFREKHDYQPQTPKAKNDYSKISEVGSVFLELREKRKHLKILKIKHSFGALITTYSFAKLSSNAILFDSLFNNSLAPQTSTIPWPNVTTTAFSERKLFSGYRNQMMCVTILILEAIRRGHGQFLVNSVPQKDTYGSNKYIPFEELWDLEHWNSFYPKLPRFVHPDPIIHDQWKPSTNHWLRRMDVDNITRYRNADESLITEDHPVHPYAFGHQRHLMAGYMRYGAGRGPYTQNGHRHPAEILILQGALRPSPYLQGIIDEKLQTLDGTAANETVEYITLHARVEPDMQRQRVCVPQKVLNLTDVFEFMEATFPDPPAARVFMPINRQYLEQEGSEETVRANHNAGKEINWIAVENLKALNRARDEGLWGGRALVFEFGANVLKETKFHDRPSTTGAILNFFVGINAKVFIGTEVSSYSHDLLATRFYRGMMENYKYLPDGLHHWTPPGTEDPPGFHC